jgi:AraC-like DNA-binding protein
MASTGSAARLPPAAGPAQLLLWGDRFLWASYSFKGAMTRRYATNVILAAGEHGFALQLPRGPIQHCHAALCASRAMRSVDASEVAFISLNLDPHAPEARALEATLPARSVRLLPPQLFAADAGPMQMLLAGQLGEAAARQLFDQLIGRITGVAALSKQVDERASRVADLLRTTLPADLDMAALAELAGVSSTRLVHLFAEQYGVPMSSYLLWAKMRRAVSLIQSGRSLTDIAQDTGFADSAHLSRTFQAFYAIKPSVLADSRLVQVRVY